MSNVIQDRFYNLLPAIYRLRDASQGEPLRALLSIIAQEFQAIESDIAGLYDNWFIETCDEWVVSYIGDLLGVRMLTHFDEKTFSQRGYIANTLAYRRRKGTAAVIEQLAKDVSGWPARAVEFFQLLKTTQNLNHLRPQNLCTVDLRNGNQLELLHGPFEQTAHAAEVRRMAADKGKYNIPNIGLYLWRLKPYRISRATASAVTNPPDGRYRFDPTGKDIPLFNQPQTERQITHLAEEINVPAPLRRRPLHDELEARRRALINGETPTALYFGSEPVLEIFVDESSDPVLPEELLICDLSNWDSPDWQLPNSQIYTKPDGSTFTTKAAVDPVMGRFAFLPNGIEPQSVQASYSYGFSSDLGAGPYDRQKYIQENLSVPVSWQVGVSKENSAVGDETIFSTLGEAIISWNALPAGNVGVITILDNRTYKENLTEDTKICIPDGSQLIIIAADWPVVRLPNNSGEPQRKIGQLSPMNLRPHLQGDVSVEGLESEVAAGELWIDGLLIEGKMNVLEGNLGKLHLSHCTLKLENGGLEVNSSELPGLQNERLFVQLYRSISGPVMLPLTIPGLDISDSIIDINQISEKAVSANGTTVNLKTCTLFGKCKVKSLDASNCIFTDQVEAIRKQIGCVRFSYMPQGSLTPRRYRCQPDLALHGVDDQKEKKLIISRLKPLFTSRQFGDPGYGQLSQRCTREILIGAEDESEMGAFKHLKQPQREANFRKSLEEYMPCGLEAGFFYTT